jgi:hypothetical protein
MTNKIMSFDEYINRGKEEKKQHLIDIMKSDEELGLYDEPKQETTLEEVAENYGWRIKTNTFSDPVKANELANSAKQDFINGAKWQQERICDSEVIQRIRASKSDAEARRIIRTI